MTSNAIVHKYVADIRPRAQVELAWFREQLTLRDAVEHAAMAVNHKGKRYRHQCRLKKSALESAKRVLLANIKAIERQEDFDNLFNLIGKLTRSIEGIGELIYL